MDKDLKIDLLLVIFDIIMLVFATVNFLFDILKHNMIFSLMSFIVILIIIYCMVDDIRELAKEKRNENNKS